MDRFGCAVDEKLCTVHEKTRFDIFEEIRDRFQAVGRCVEVAREMVGAAHCNLLDAKMMHSIGVGV